MICFSVYYDSFATQLLRRWKNRPLVLAWRSTEGFLVVHLCNVSLVLLPLQEHMRNILLGCHKLLHGIFGRFCFPAIAPLAAPAHRKPCFHSSGGYGASLFDSHRYQRCRQTLAAAVTCMQFGGSNGHDGARGCSSGADSGGPAPVSSDARQREVAVEAAGGRHAADWCTERAGACEMCGDRMGARAAQAHSRVSL